MKNLLEKAKNNYRKILGLDFTISKDELLKLVTDMTKNNSVEDLINSNSLFEQSMQNSFNKMPKYNYCGIFLDTQSSVVQDTLFNIKDNLALENIIIPSNWNYTEQLHITTSFSNPEIKPDYSDIGTQVDFSIVGYAYNPNIGFALDVRLDNANEHIKSEFEATKKLRKPHITIANPPGVKPSESAKLFEENSETIYESIEPVQIRGSYGGMTNEFKIDILNNKEKLFKYFAEKLLESYINNNPYNSALINSNIKDIGDRTLYLKSIIEQRMDGPMNAGSSFEKGMTTEDVLFALATYPYTETTEFQIKNGGIKKTQRCFEIPLKGKQGVISINELSDDVEIIAVDGHGTENISFCVNGINKKPVKTTTIISFVDSNRNCTFVSTVLPGDVRSPSIFINKGILEGEKFSKLEVIEMTGSDCIIKYVSEDRFKILSNKFENSNQIIKQKYLDIFSESIQNMVDSLKKYYIKDDKLVDSLKNEIDIKQINLLYEAAFDLSPVTYNDIISNEKLKSNIEILNKELKNDFFKCFKTELDWDTVDLNAFGFSIDFSNFDEVNDYIENLLETSIMENGNIILESGYKMSMSSLNTIINARLTENGLIGQVIEEIMNNEDPESMKIKRLLLNIDKLCNQEFINSFEKNER